MLPYHGRSRAKRIAYARGQNVGGSGGGDQKKNVIEPDALYLDIENQVMKFGDTDLIIDYNLKTCRSTLESSYGMGLPLDGDATTTFLAGTKKFECLFCEIYQIHRSDDKNVVLWGF